MTDYMTMRLQLLFLLDANFNKQISIWDHDLCMKKNLLNSIWNQGRNPIYHLMKNFLNLMKKQGAIPEELIDKKSLKFNKKIRKKTDHLLL